MLGSPDPLGERLTLMWHDHFATAQSKVEDLGLMRRQNDTFRRHARAPFGELLNASIREPALLLYLDAPSNRKGHPNENLARELMELFTLGIGHYTEADVKEAARALTGWTVEEGPFREAPSKHDDGEKTLLGRKGKWSGADLLAILLDQPATRSAARREDLRPLFGRRGRRRIGDRSPWPMSSANKPGHRPGGRDRAPIPAFFAPSNLGSRVLGPVEFVIGACRALVPVGSTPSTLILADWTTRLGQDLFDPPNVGGWPGGRAWLTPRSLVGRANFAAALVEGRPVGLPGPLDAGDRDREGLEKISYPRRRLGPAAGDRAARVARGAGETNPRGRPTSLAAVLASPEAQLD